MKCPHCQNKIEVPDLWEFFDCTKCGASLQLENNELKILKRPDDNTATNYESESQQNSEEYLSAPVEDSVPEGSNQKSLSEPTVDSTSSNPKEDTSENFSQVSNEEVSSPAESHSPNNEQITAFNSTPIENISNPLSSEESDNLSNILDFENPSNQKNHFIYHLQISEISSKALFDKIRHILKSPRVKLDCPNQAKNNTLVINNLNAVQMVYVVRKLSLLPVGIHWQQKSTLTE